MSYNPNYFELETDRLQLRKLNMNDLQDIYEYGSDQEVSKYVLWNKYESREDAKSFAQSVIDNYEKGNNNIWAIEYKEDKKMIGTIDFIGYSEKYKRSSLGYVLNKTYWNKGLMTEAVEAVIKHAFEVLDLNKVSASAIDFNVGSYKVMEKAGMINEGITRQHFSKNDIFYDLVNYSILRSEYMHKE
jgi:ribosomal-protein-alanine N-acetyltransferase